MRRFTGVLSLAVGGALVLAACGGGGNTGQEVAPQSGDSGTVVVAQRVEFPTLDYTETPNQDGQRLLLHNVIEPLLERMQDGTYEPLLAESYEVGADGRQYDFTIREATFHDGSTLGPEDVVYSLELYRNAANAELSGVFAGVETIEQLDDRTVRVTLTEPSQRFLQGMSRHGGMIIPDGSAAQLVDAPIGTGPYVFDEWRQGVEVRLSRYEDYWGDAPSFSDVRWRFMPDLNAIVNALVAGEVDIAYALSEGQIEDQIGQVPEGIEFVTDGGSAMLFLHINSQDPVFADERIRQAIAHAINREEIVAVLRQRPEQAACAFVNPPTEPWSTDHCPYPYDPDRARELLADAGVEGLSIQFKSATDKFFADAVEVISAQLEAVGITVERDLVDIPTLTEETQAGNYQLAYTGFSQQIDAFACPPILTFDCMPELDELLAQADRSLEVEEWSELRRQAVEMHADRAFVIPVLNGAGDQAVREDITGVKPYRSFVEFDLRGLRRES